MHTTRASSESTIQFMSSVQKYCMIDEAEGKHPATQMSESEKKVSTVQILTEWREQPFLRPHEPPVEINCCYWAETGTDTGFGTTILEQDQKIWIVVKVKKNKKRGETVCPASG